ncbi:uncharacterized protein LOC108916694 [Anoplophora glabripennis]|uniref:uncharacterized protein LOC108916694 n=1 Tax=Anoplophora glabripennis TaxID=217634 RepID=UPI0008752B72|nr:uncharacterized protein LOC108916694 [Anoplophora glabripennis]
MSQLLEIAQGTKTNKVAMGSTTLDDEIAMETAILSDEISHETTLDVDAIETALDESEFDLTNSSSLPSPSMNKTLSTSNTNVKRTRLIDMDLGYVPRKSWTTPEKQNARDLFANCIESNVLPSLKDCKIAQQNNIHLKNRSPQQLRLWIHNEINKKKETQCSERLD